MKRGEPVIAVALIAVSRVTALGAICSPRVRPVTGQTLAMLPTPACWKILTPFRLRLANVAVIRESCGGHHRVLLSSRVAWVNARGGQVNTTLPIARRPSNSLWFRYTLSVARIALKILGACPDRLAAEIYRLIAKVHSVSRAEVSNMVEKEACRRTRLLDFL
jgi:hypothetical protein